MPKTAANNAANNAETAAPTTAKTTAPTAAPTAAAAASPSTLYGIPNCDTVKQARSWLAGQGHSVPFHDFKKQGVPADPLKQWLQAAGWQVLVNRQGSTWRKLSAAEQASVVDNATAQALLLAQPSIIKRPVVQWADGVVTVGLQAMMDRASGSAA